jgi:hypothetical protein
MGSSRKARALMEVTEVGNVKEDNDEHQEKQ